MASPSLDATAQEHELLEAVRRGDPDAYGSLVTPYRGQLHAPSWVEPYPDTELGIEDGFAAPEARYEQRESIELAFVAALQHLPARQRAALILHDVLGFSAREVADSLETTVTSVNSALQRARGNVNARVPGQSQQATLRSLGDARQRQIVESFIDARDRSDLDALVGLLTEEAAWSMPPLATWYRGLEAIAAFLGGWPLRARWRRVPVRANGQLAGGCYMWDAEKRHYAAYVLDVLTLSGARIQEVTAFLTPAVFPSFGLPPELPPATAP